MGFSVFEIFTIFASRKDEQLLKQYPETVARTVYITRKLNFDFAKKANTR